MFCHIEGLVTVLVKMKILFFPKKFTVKHCGIISELKKGGENIQSSLVSSWALHS